MKILLVTQEYPPQAGGAGIVAEQNACGLAEKGHDVYVVTRMMEKDNVERDSKVMLKRVSGPRKLWPVLMAYEVFKLKPGSFDRIIINDIGAMLVFLIFFGNKYFNKYVIYLHGGEVDKIVNARDGVFKRKIIQRRYFNLIENCRNIIAVSNYMKCFFSSSIPQLNLLPKIKVVYAGVDSKQFNPQKPVLKELSETGDGNTLLMTVGRVIEGKGFIRMLRLFEKAYDYDSGMKWVVIGDGPFFKKFQQEVCRSEAKAGVKLLGKVERSELAKYYSSADLFWLLSDKDAFGLVYIEAQLCGCPAMGVRSHGVQEAIEDNKSGFLIETDDECISILLEKKFKKLKKSEVLMYAEKFKLYKCLESLDDVIKD